MHNCIFTGHCIEEQPCNASCPALAQTSYLLERNDIKMTNPVFKMSEADMCKYYNILNASAGKTTSVIVQNSDFTNQTADALTYCAICENWRGSQLHCTVYNLKFPQYIEALQSSWSFGNNDDAISQMKIWIANARVLIISNLDFINFKEFQSQTLLSLLQSRVGMDLTTIVVTPPVSSLIGEGQFFGKLTNILTKQKVGENL